MHSRYSRLSSPIWHLQKAELHPKKKVKRQNNLRITYRHILGGIHPYTGSYTGSLRNPNYIDIHTVRHRYTGSGIHRSSFYSRWCSYWLANSPFSLLVKVSWFSTYGQTGTYSATAIPRVKSSRNFIFVILIENRAAFINVKQMLNFARERRSTQSVDRVNLVLFEIITCEMAHLSGKIITVQTFRLFFKYEN